jgi:hypothetical protein
MKYDKDHTDIIIKELEEGNGRVRACKAAGINYQTFINWMEDPEKLEFLEAVKKAELSGDDKIKDICKRKIIEDKSWQSGAWWLERNFPDSYKNKTESNVHVETVEIPKIEITFRDAD